MTITKTELELATEIPLLHLNPMLDNGENIADIYVALLHTFPTGSHKILPYIAMIKSEEQKRRVKSTTRFVEYTSGNAGIAAAYVCATKGYAFTAFMPENMTPEKIQMMKALGADLRLTPKDEFIVGARNGAVEFVAEDPENRILLDQSNNPNNPKGFEVVGKRFVDELANIDAYVCGGGTYGTITGVAGFLKRYDSKIQVVCVEAEYAPHVKAQRECNEVKFQPHNLIGFAAERLASTAKPELYDRIETIDEETSIVRMKQLHSKGLLVGKTSGANIEWAIKVAEELGPGKVVCTNTYDQFSRLVSEKLYD